MLNELRSDCFVDIGGIVYHHYLNVLFHNSGVSVCWKSAYLMDMLMAYQPVLVLQYLNFVILFYLIFLFTFNVV